VVIPVQSGTPNKSLFSNPPSALQDALGVAWDAARARVAGELQASSALPRITSPVAPGESIPMVALAPKRSKYVRLCRKWAWMKHDGGYLAVMPYYLAAPDDEDRLQGELGRCQHTWFKERKGESERYRAVGCGHRVECPACATYRQNILAREAVESMLLAQEALAARGVVLDCYGFKTVLTMPKRESERIDALLQTDIAAWQVEVNKVFEIGREFAREWFGKGAGGSQALHLSGESAPTEPHYHLDGYAFPAVRQGKHWKALQHWTPKELLLKMRRLWAKLLNRAFGLHLEEADVRCTYLGTEARLNHCLHYLYRPVLSDLWNGWAGVDGGISVLYAYAKGKKQKLLSPDDLANLASRLRAIPSHFKRIRHFGPFSDGQRGKTMASLGLEPEVVAGDGEASKGWERMGAMCRFVRYVAEGVVLREVLPNDGVEPEFDDDGWPVWRERLGPEFVVRDDGLDYHPSGVSIGKRKRWRLPGKTEGVSDG